jgi:phosphoribosylanthranilate isomerase
VAAGAAALGLVSAMPSGPGPIGEDLIAEIAARVPPPVATFLLTCLDRAAAIAEQHERCRTSVLQLVDRVEPAELRALRPMVPGVKLVQVIHVRDHDAVDEALEIAPFVDALLLDSGNPSLAVKELGGTGRVHDWQVSAKLCAAVDKPVFLAGGLNVGNVAEAIAIVRPYGLDLCSGVRASGALDAAKLAEFMAAVRASASRPPGPVQELGLVSLVVRDYEEALAFYVGGPRIHAGRGLSGPGAGQALGGGGAPGRHRLPAADRTCFDARAADPRRQPDGRSRVPLPLHRQLRARLRGVSFARHRVLCVSPAMNRMAPWQSSRIPSAIFGTW